MVLGAAYPVTTPGDGLNAVFGNLADAASYAYLKNAACPGSGYSAGTGVWTKYTPLGGLPRLVVGQQSPVVQRILLPSNTPWVIVSSDLTKVPCFWAVADLKLWASHQSPGTQCQGSLTC